MLPLDGVTVVAIEQAVAAPFCTRQLADLGARVIKVERPGSGDFARQYDTAVRGMSSHFAWLNRSKESLTLDLKHPEAGKILSNLLRQADVFIHNLIPGAVDRLGMGSERLAADYPRLIICSISGYGSSGPYRDKKAYDLLIQCECGLLSITGTPDTPSKAGISIADIASGSYAYSGILTALYQRERTGAGTVLEVSMLEALGEWMGFPAYYAAYGGVPPARTGARHAVIAPYGPFPTGDGQMVFLSVQNEREWKRFCADVLCRPELELDRRFATNALRVANREALDPAIIEVFQGFSRERAIERLDGAQIANARMNTMEDFWQHPQLLARGRWRTVGSPVGELRALLPPATMRGVEPRMDPIPALGEQTDAILGWLGYTPAEVEALRAAGAV